jgi:hypothetical protein
MMTRRNLHNFFLRLFGAFYDAICAACLPAIVAGNNHIAFTKHLHVADNRGLLAWVLFVVRDVNFGAYSVGLRDLLNLRIEAQSPAMRPGVTIAVQGGDILKKDFVSGAISMSRKHDNHSFIVRQPVRFVKRETVSKL